MKKLLIGTIVAAGAGVIVGLYVAMVSVGTAGQTFTRNYRACEPLYCQNIPTASTTVIAEGK